MEGLQEMKGGIEISRGRASKHEGAGIENTAPAGIHTSYIHDRGAHEHEHEHEREPQLGCKHELHCGLQA